MPDTLQRPNIDGEENKNPAESDAEFQKIVDNNFSSADKSKLNKVVDEAEKTEKEEGASEAVKEANQKKAFEAARKATGYGKDALLDLLEESGMGEKGLEDMLRGAGMSENEAKRAAKRIADKGLFKKDDDQSSFRKKVHKARKIVKKVRWFYDYRILFGFLVMAGILILLLLLVGALKLPDVMQSIESYEFAQVSREFFDDSRMVTDEGLVVNINDDGSGVFSKLKSVYGNLRDGVWEKVVGQSPNKVITNMGEQNGLELRYRTSKLTGREIFTGGSINNVDFEFNAPSGIGRWTPGVRQYMKFRAYQNFYSQGFLDQAMNDMKARDVAPIVRGVVFLKLLYSVGGSLTGWALNKFTGNNDNANEVTAGQEEFAAQQQGANAPDNATTSEISQADQAAQQQEAKDAQDPNQVLKIMQNGGLDPAAQAAANAALSGSLLTNILHATGFVWGVVAPFCIIFDGSVVQSGPAINNQMNQVQTAFDQLAAEADQQKLGDQTKTDDGELANAVGGTNNEIGDISTSLPYQRAYGRIQSTDFIPSVEAGSDGSYQYSLLNVLGVPATSLEGRVVNGVVSTFCHVMTNIWTSVGLTIAQIIAFFLTLGTEPAIADAAGETATQWISRYFSAIIIKLVGKEVVTQGVKKITVGLTARIVRFALVQGAILVGTLGLSFLAHMIVASRATVAHDGLATGRDLVDDADNGGNIQGGLFDREMLFGRPLTANEAAQAETANMQQVNYENSQKSWTDRYFALSNYDSLLTHIGMDLGASDHFSIISSIVRLGSSLLNPLHSMSSLFGNILNPTVFAAADSISYDYGNIQWGYSDAEEQLIASDKTYSPLENQKILDDAPQINGMSAEDAIAQNFSKCFGYDYNPGSTDDNLDPNDTNGRLALAPDATVSALLTAAQIDRDGNTGDVINGGALCDPDTLSFDSTSTFAADPQTPELNGWRSPKSNDMIFRWRLAEGYEDTADQLISEGVLTK